MTDTCFMFAGMIFCIIYLYQIMMIFYMVWIVISIIENFEKNIIQYSIFLT